MGRYISNINTNSYQDNELLLLKQGFAKNRKAFLSTGANTWTIDHDVIARVRVWGGGGGGGASAGSGVSTSDNTLACGGGGGGAGGAAEAILRLKAGTYNITVGAGGAGGKRAVTTGLVAPATGGSGGGSSSFHTYITCSGGNGGATGPGGGVQGGLGGSATFDLNNFDGFLYMDSRPGGAGGSFATKFYVKDPTDSAHTSYRVYRGGERGEGESGGPASYSILFGTTLNDTSYGGGGGGGYNPPFIYGPGRGVGTGGRGGGGHYKSGYGGNGGNSGAVVIEWN